MGAPVPASYLVLADILKKEAQLMASSPFPVLSSSRLKWLMTEKGLIQKMTPEDLDQAIQFLHDSGFLLHYNDTYSKLSEMYFLNPEWLCQLMGKVITIPEINPALKTRKGVSLVEIFHKTEREMVVVRLSHRIQTYYTGWGLVQSRLHRKPIGCMGYRSVSHSDATGMCFTDAAL